MIRAQRVDRNEQDVGFADRRGRADDRIAPEDLAVGRCIASHDLGFHSQSAAGARHRIERDVDVVPLGSLVGGHRTAKERDATILRVEGHGVGDLLEACLPCPRCHAEAGSEIGAPWHVQLEGGLWLAHDEPALAADGAAAEILE